MAFVDVSSRYQRSRCTPTALSRQRDTQDRAGLPGGCSVHTDHIEAAGEMQELWWVTSTGALSVTSIPMAEMLVYSEVTYDILDSL